MVADNRVTAPVSSTGGWGGGGGERDNNQTDDCGHLRGRQRWLRGEDNNQTDDCGHLREEEDSEGYM